MYCLSRLSSNSSGQLSVKAYGWKINEIKDGRGMLLLNPGYRYGTLPGKKDCFSGNNSLIPFNVFQGLDHRNLTFIRFGPGYNPQFIHQSLVPNRTHSLWNGLVSWQWMAGHPLPV